MFKILRDFVKQAEILSIVWLSWFQSILKSQLRSHKQLRLFSYSIECKIYDT